MERTRQLVKLQDSGIKSGARVTFAWVIRFLFASCSVYLAWLTCSLILLTSLAQDTGPARSVRKTLSAQPADSAPQPTSAADARIATLENDLKAAEGRVAELDRVVGYERERLAAIDSTSRFLVSGAGIFAVLLGIGSWKILEDQAKASKERFDQQISAISALKSELESEFPMFGRMRKNFVRVLSDLRSACGRLEVRDDAVRKLGWEERQRILFYEKGIADSVLIGTEQFRSEISEIFRLLGIFYGSRYTQAHRENSSVSEDDLERSRFYFDRAIENGPGDYSGYAAAGYFMMDYQNPAQAMVARNYLRQAAALGTNKQRPLINVAFLELHAFHDPETCIDVLREASSRKEWEEEGSKPKPGIVNYTMACALAVKASTVAAPNEEEAWTNAVGLLELAAGTADDWMRQNFSEKEDGRPSDKELFRRARSFPALAARFDDAATKIETAA